MKKSILCVGFIAIAMTLMSQKDYLAKSQYDYIGHGDFYILRPDTDVKGNKSLKASELKSKKSAELLFGTEYKIKQFSNESSLENITQLSYNDGLRLDISDDEKSQIQFVITSDRYSLYLENGQSIKIGMNGDELKNIFPKSYSKRTVITNWAGFEGKTSFIVYFARMINNKLEYEDSWIIFVLGKENNLLEQVRSYIPD